jgi:hypothetical protein
MIVIASTCFACAAALHAQTRGPQSPAPQPGGPASRQESFFKVNAELVPLTTYEALQRADRVLYVQSTGKEVIEGIGGNIFTDTTFQILRTIKGKTAAQVKVRSLGGQIRDRIVTGPMDLNFAPGDKFVLFLSKESPGDGLPSFIPQATFAVKSQGGVDYIEPSPTDIPLFHARDEKAYTGTPGRLPAEDFLFSLGKAR